MILQKAKTVLDEAVGSIRIPEKYTHLSIGNAVKQAKKDYFKNHPHWQFATFDRKILSYFKK
jgi:hypothetical protein